MGKLRRAKAPPPVRPDLIQLHAGESLELTAALAADLAPLGIGVIKTVPASPEARLDTLLAAMEH